MRNTFLNEMISENNLTFTENDGITRKTTKSDVLDMFALGGAYRPRSEEDVILLFKNAYEENKDLALKCLFYLRDIRGGQGERRFFRVAFRWLCKNASLDAFTNLKNISEYGRWDDLIYSTFETPLQDDACRLIEEQLYLDNKCKTPSLLAKWLPSQNASNKTTKKYGHIIANYIGATDRQYRKMLSSLREKIKIVERLMSENRWDEIQFDKIPSRAGIIYRNAFARRDILAKRYEEFAKDKTTKVNAEALYPQDVCSRAWKMVYKSFNDPERLMLQKYWDNLKDFYCGREENAIAIVDVSGSMTGTPMDAAVSLGAYIADKSHGPFAHHFITFSDHPQLVRFNGVDIVDKFARCRQADWGGSTNIQAVFDLLLETARSKNVRKEDMPKRLYIFSDMEFNSCVSFGNSTTSRWGYSQYKMVKSVDEANSDLEKIRIQWMRQGYELPEVIFWNLSAREDHIPAIGDGFSYISGFSPVMVEQVLGGKTGYDLMIDKLVRSGRYKKVISVY